MTRWEAYDTTRWHGEFRCATRQAFGTDNACWDAGQPTTLARQGVQPQGPMLLVHSPGDDWVQASQASELFKVLRPPSLPKPTRARADGDGRSSSSSNSSSVVDAGGVGNDDGNGGVPNVWYEENGGRKGHQRQPQRHHRLDLNGSCAHGQHSDVLKGASAILLANCLAELAVNNS